ncbi:MAG: hypothetical protein IJL58_05360 [Bacteroidales bacterium]|nr:hypothetical protein [Bacteroidales bacterium]
MRQLEEMDVVIWRVVASVTAGILAVCLVKAVMGKMEFPWWHLATLAIAWKMGDCSRAFSAILARLRRYYRQGRATWRSVASRVKSAAKVSNSLARKQGRLRRVPALFDSTTNEAA